MPFNIQIGTTKAFGSANYAGYTLESARSAYIASKIELEDFEILVECILWEEAHPQEQKLKAKGTQIKDGRMETFEVYDKSFPSVAFEVDQSHDLIAPPKPDDSLRSVMPPTKSYGCTMAF